MNQTTPKGRETLVGTDFQEALPRLHERAVEHRRYLHQHPELSGVEHETTQYIERELQSWGIRILQIPGPGVIAQIDAVTPGAPVVALRADIDALPVPEDDAKPLVSLSPGISHACGHDGHTGILLAVAEWLAINAHRLKTSVRLIFQSSEEQIPSGAQRLFGLGALEDVESIFGLHLWRDLAAGEIGVNDGPLMASTDDFDIIFSGPGGHGASPHESVDVIVSAARLVADLQAVVARKQDPLRPLVVTVGHLEAHGNHNVMPARAHLQGTVRALDPLTRDDAQRWVTDTANGVAQQSGAEVDITYQRGTPPLINESESARFAQAAARRHCSDVTVGPIRPVMGGEDFSLYLEKVPGAFIFIGMGGPNSQHAHHTPKFNLDEDMLKTGIELMIGIIDDYGSQLQR